MTKIKNILVPVDFSEGCMKTVKYVEEMAEIMSSKLHIVHVIEPLVFSSDFVMTKYGVDELPNELEMYAKKDLAKITDALAAKKIDIVSRILHGRAYEEILDYADKHHMDMICISHHGHSNLENMIFGSTTERVLRKAKCPVLVVRVLENNE